VVLEGTYVVDENSLDIEEAKDQGWWDLAKTVRSRDDVFLFISKHGGNPKTSVSKDTDFILGGSSNDARVYMHNHGLEEAIKDRRRIRSKNGLSLEDMTKIGFVRKWTYVYTIVHEWISELSGRVKVEEGEESQNSATFGSSILSTHPHLLRPDQHHLLQPSDMRTNMGDHDNLGRKSGSWT